MNASIDNRNPPRGAVSAQLPFSCDEFHTAYLRDESPPGPRPSE